MDRILAGRYKVVAPIGEGGMSRVWRAQDLNTGKFVAVKVLRDEYREDETFVRRFEREALAASKMTHPNIANLLDVGVEEDGTRYLVIEYVSGKTLKQFIQESGTIRPETAAQIIMRVLAAVQHAHQNGVIHRDIKPQNILIDKEGAVKVADFGIARVANAQTMNQDTETVMGSVYYFSPEQAKGALVDEKSDLYSVGVMFYEMLTGQVPFTGDTPVAIAMKHIQDTPVPPSEICGAVSQAMDFVVLHAMEKRARNRYVSAADMLRDVRLALDHPDTILAARAEMERRGREVRLEQRRRDHVEKRVRWMRRALMSVFSAILLAAIVLAGYTITDQVLTNRRLMVEVPSVIGLKNDIGINMLLELELEIIPEYEEFPLVPEGFIADQSLAPGVYAKRGDKITITICQSKYQLSTPNLVGMSVTVAQKTIIDLGLVVGATDYVPDPATPYTVVGQEPVHGTLVNRGEKVTLLVSEGRVTMPDLFDMTQSQAEQTVVAYGLTIGDVKYTPTNDPAMVDRVTFQRPEPYAPVSPNAAVEIIIGTGDALFMETITLDLSALGVGQTVAVYVVDEQGREIRQFTRTIEEPVGELPVPLYSVTVRTAPYVVYFDDVAKTSGVVVFRP